MQCSVIRQLRVTPSWAREFTEFPNATLFTVDLVSFEQEPSQGAAAPRPPLKGEGGQSTQVSWDGIHHTHPSSSPV